ncbi:MFS transporter [Francisella sp. SYW-9]|uniref:POT-type proton-dependent oligopeptide transporter n=1 Tax=Francisella sp. SYW-9 TaxID=2610888 RepID=UPI00123E18C0|nr:MFS transporter [Francisella sp. SYW-9]
MKKSESKNYQSKKRIYPIGLVPILIVQVFIIFPLVCLSSTIVYYMQSVGHINTSQAVIVFSISFSLIWGGNWFGVTAGRLVNRHQVIIVGIMLIFISLICLANNWISIIYSIALFATGFVFFAPNKSILINYLYEKNDVYGRNSAITLLQFFVNIGSAGAAILFGIFVKKIGYRISYEIVSIFPILGLFIYLYLSKKVHLSQDNKKIFFPQDRYHIKNIVLITLLGLVTSLIFFIIFKLIKLETYIIFTISGIVLLFIIYKARVLLLEEKIMLRSLIIIFILIVLASSIDAFIPSVISLFINSNVDRHIFRYVLPASSFQGFNSIMVVILCLPLSLLWSYKSKSSHNINNFKYISGGFIAYGLGFLVLSLAIMISPGKLNVFIILLFYLTQAIAFTLVSPGLNSLIFKYIPKKMDNLIFGIFSFTGAFAGLTLTFLTPILHIDIISHKIQDSTKGVFVHTFFYLSLYPLIIAILIIAFYKLKISSMKLFSHKNKT